MTVVMSSRWRALLFANLFLAGTAIAAAALYPHLQLPGVGEGFDLVFYGVLVILGGMLRHRLRRVAVATLVYPMTRCRLRQFM